MASSDLTLQMLMAGQQPAGQDPAVMAALPRLQMAQAMLQSGLSDAPTSRLGVLSRMGQALVGNYALDKATTGLQSAYGQVGPDLAATLPPNHPLIPALTSPNPMVRYEGMQAYQKMMPLLGTVEKLSPGQSPYIGATPAGGPASGAYSPQGAVAVDAQHNPNAGAQAGSVMGPIAGAEANAGVPAHQANSHYDAALGVWEKNNAPIPNTPAGTTMGQGAGEAAPAPPGMLNIPGRGNIIPPKFDSMTGAPLGQFTTQAPQMPPGVRPVGPGNPQGSNVPIPSVTPAMLPPQAPAPNPGASRAPGQTAGISALPAEPIVSENAKNFSALAKSAGEARGEIAQAQLLQKDLNSLGSTGPATPFLANLSRYAAQAGVPQNVIDSLRLPNGATEAQAAANANMLAMEVAKAKFPGRVTNVDIQLAKSTKPSTEMPLSASNFLINNSIIPQAQWAVDRFNNVANMGVPADPSYSPGYAALESKLNQFDNAHPITGYMPHLQSTPAAAAAAALRAHPSQSADYDARYGAGSAAQILGTPR